MQFLRRSTYHEIPRSSGRPHLIDIPLGLRADPFFRHIYFRWSYSKIGGNHIWKNPVNGEQYWSWSPSRNWWFYTGDNALTLTRVPRRRRR